MVDTTLRDFALKIQPMLQPPSGLLEMASLRLPDSEEFDIDTRRRTSGNVGLTTISPPHKSIGNDVFVQTKDDLREYLNSSLTDLVTASSRSRIEETSGFLFNASENGNIPIEHAADRFYRHSISMTAVYCIAYMLVFVIGLIGNSFVIAVVYRSPRMRTVTNFFIVNLAIADVLVIVFCLPATLVGNILVREYFFSSLPSRFLNILHARIEISFTPMMYFIVLINRSNDAFTFIHFYRFIAELINFLPKSRNVKRDFILSLTICFIVQFNRPKKSSSIENRTRNGAILRNKNIHIYKKRIKKYNWEHGTEDLVMTYMGVFFNTLLGSTLFGESTRDTPTTVVHKL